MTSLDNAPILYSFRRCPYAIRARMALHISGQTCRLREVILKEKPGHMLEISPKGTVPILQLADGTVIDESVDIMFWALERDDPARWLPGDEQTRANMLALIVRNDEEFKFHLDRMKYPNRYEGADGEEHRQSANAFLETLEGLLGENTYLFGSHLSFADVAIVPFVRQFANVDRGRFDGLPFPKLQAWLAGVLQSSVFSNVMEKYAQWTDGDPGVLFPEA